MWKDFKEFLIKQNAVALAIAVVLGAALNTLVQALVNDVIMPVVTVATPKDAQWQTYALSIGPFHFPLGHLASAMLNFVIIGFTAWRISKLVTPPPAPPAALCKYCKSVIDPAATRCPQCTSQLA
ncbi:MAG TPA: MscL family protein [Gemmatimonadaceae bacterium]|nr:MscL family protein [Gemmatimonadaceae bacterium]